MAESRAKPRLAVADFIAIPAGSQNLWAHALMDPRFSAVEKRLLVVPGARTRLSEADCRAAAIQVHEFGARAPRAAQAVARRLGLGGDPLSRALGRVDPDLVWFNLAGIGEIGWIDRAAAWCRTHRVPYWLIVQHVHENFFFASDAHASRAREVAGGAARVLVVSRRNREALAAAFAERMANVEAAVNGVPKAFLEAAADVATSRPPRADGTARFISPARFDPAYKGQHLLFAAFAGAAWKERDWHLSLVGGGPHEELLRRLVAFFGLPRERVTFVPFTNDMPGAFAESDVIVMPSLSEGAPFALAEGMACGRAAVGTPVGGIDELVRDGETGWLAHSTEPSDVAAALDRCWRDRALWPRMGRAAQLLASTACDLEPAHRSLLAHVLADARAR